jgi:hypothetical protein
MSLSEFLKIYISAKKGAIFQQIDETTVMKGIPAPDTTFKEMDLYYPNLAGKYDILNSEEVFSLGPDGITAIPSNDGEYEILIFIVDDSEVGEYLVTKEFKKYDATMYMEKWKKENSYASPEVFSFAEYISKQTIPVYYDFNKKFYWGSLGFTKTTFDAPNILTRIAEVEFDKLFMEHEKEIVDSVCTFLKNKKAYIPPVPDGYF